MVRNMRRIIASLCVLSLLALNDASANETFSCGPSTVDISFTKRPKAKDAEEHVEALLSVTDAGRTTTLRYDGTVDFIGAMCAANAQKEPTVVFQAYCGGSACRDQDNWGIIDPKTLRVLLVPNDGNRKDARTIFGRPLPKIARMISVSEEAAKLGVK